MKNRQQHQQEVQGFLQKKFSSHSWEFTLPHGFGNECYFAHGNECRYFVKLNAPIANYQAMASIGLTPPVLASGLLEDGTSILVQPFIDGRKPTQRDYRTYLVQIAETIDRMQHSQEVKRVLPPAPSGQYNVLGRQALECVRNRWEQYKGQVPSLAALVDEGLTSLENQVQSLCGAGLVVSHNDICNANWLIATDGHFYLIDLDAMSLDDPAFDIGATLWWYYPPELRPRFIEIVGQTYDEQFQNRMRVRMATHCLSITLPREHSFDQFNPATYSESLTDYFAVLSGKENPQGYNN